MSDGTVEFQLTPESRALIDALFIRFGKEKVYRAIVIFFNRMALIVAGRISRIVLKTLRQQGNLARAITGRGELINGIPACRVGLFEGPAIRYAGVLEFGTKGKDSTSPYDTIKPKKAKTLAVPIETSLTASGVPRYPGPRQDERDLRFVPIFRGRVVGKLVVDSVKKRRVLARAAFAEVRAAQKNLRRVTDDNLVKVADREEFKGHSIPGAPKSDVVSLARKTARDAVRVAKRRLASVVDEIQKASIAPAQEAYLLLRKVDIEPRHYLRDNFLKMLPEIAANLGEGTARYLNSGSAA